VVYSSEATTLVSGDTNAAMDVFLFDLTTSTNTRVSVSSSGIQGDRTSDGAIFSTDGKQVFFGSAATNLVSGDTNGVTDLFVRNLQTNQTSRLSLTSTGGEANGAPDWVASQPVVTADASLLFYVSAASNLVPNDTNGKNDIFLIRLK
jgi:Tol biopolymer transport system component